jgi:hypothetical protein
MSIIKLAFTDHLLYTYNKIRHQLSKKDMERYSRNNKNDLSEYYLHTPYVCATQCSTLKTFTFLSSSNLRRTNTLASVGGSVKSNTRYIFNICYSMKYICYYLTTLSVCTIWGFHSADYEECCLLGLFNSEEGGDTFLRNVGLPELYTAPHPRRQHSDIISNSDYLIEWQRVIYYGGCGRKRWDPNLRFSILAFDWWDLSKLVKSSVSIVGVRPSTSRIQEKSVTAWLNLICNCISVRIAILLTSINTATVHVSLLLYIFIKVCWYG